MNKVILALTVAASFTLSDNTDALTAVPRCTADNVCTMRLTLTPGKVARAQSNRDFGVNATVIIKVYIANRLVMKADSSGTSWIEFAQSGAVVRASTPKSGRAPIRFAAVSLRRTRVRIVYWTVG